MNATNQSAKCIVLLLLLLSIATSTTASEIITHGNFDELSVGTAPDVGLAAGAWQIIENGHGESGESNYSIVATSEFDPGADGNSLQIRRPEVRRTPTGVTNIFNQVIHQNEGEIVRASFDLFVPETETMGQPGLTLFIGGDHDGGLSSHRQTDRGPQLRWNHDGTVQHMVCDPSDDCSGRAINVLVEETPLDVWQHVQVDIDLTSDTYDLFVGSEQVPLKLVAPYVGFRSGSQDFLDRFGVFFAGNPENIYRQGSVYLDNLTIEVIRKDWIGDANLDGEFNSGDFVNVFQAGKYETGELAGWSHGDWNADRVFDSGDFVAAFQDGGYEMGPRATVAAVPEPSSWILLTLGLISVGHIRRR